jgi:UDP-N-acetylglucosamine 4,6-dehydratase
MSIINGGSILVTGGTGSFGKAFIRAILARHKPKRVVVYSRDELKQFEMSKQKPYDDARMRYFIGDVRDAGRLARALDGIDFVVHAAALKQVPACEYNPFEAVRTNVLGAQNIIEASIDRGVKRVVALSTDKACAPVNLYGATKLCSDKLFVGGNSYVGAHGTRFAVVRYGNVMGSRGSVIPFFANLLKGGAKELPVTHKDMTRFWIKLEAGVELVLTAFETTRGGELFVPKIPSMKVTDLAQAMAPRLPVKEVGIRPGEKLHEMLISREDARQTMDMGGHYVVLPAFDWWGGMADFSGGKRVSEDFEYRSDTNTQWLSLKEMRAFLKKLSLH